MPDEAICDDQRAIRSSRVFVIEQFSGTRSDLLHLFAEADDSLDQIKTYMNDGQVLIARRGKQLLGHVQSIPTGQDWEIKSVAVIQSEQGCGIGTSLIRAALDAAWSSGARRVLLATATADIRNLRFYQRLGFRMDRVERDVFTIERGYPPVKVDGIPLRDRVWLSIEAPHLRDLPAH